MTSESKPQIELTPDEARMVIKAIEEVEREEANKQSEPCDTSQESES